MRLWNTPPRSTPHTLRVVIEFKVFGRYGLPTDNLARRCGAEGDWGVSRLSCEVRCYYPYMSPDDCRLIRNMFSHSLLSRSSISLSLLPSPSLRPSCLSSPGVIALFCRQYDIIKDNEPNTNKDKAKNSSECSTPEHQSGGLLRSKV